MKVTRGDVAQELLSREGKLSLPPLCPLEAGSTWRVWIKKLGMDSRRFHCPWCLACGVRPALRHSISPSLAVRDRLSFIILPTETCCWEKHGSAGNGPWHGSRELCRGNYELVLLQAACKGHTGDELGIFYSPPIVLFALTPGIQVSMCCLSPAKCFCLSLVSAGLKELLGGWSCPKVLQVRVSMALGWKGP